MVYIPLGEFQYGLDIEDDTIVTYDLFETMPPTSVSIYKDEELQTVIPSEAISRLRIR